MLYEKINSLNKLVDKGLNVHSFYIPTTYIEFEDLLINLKYCTIRTAHREITKDMPFYIFNIGIDKPRIKEIWQESVNSGYRLIVSDGIKYDNIQSYNMVVKLSRNGDFIFEASELKIPLRHMYRHPLLSCSGNIKGGVRDWEVYNNRNTIDKRNIKHVLEELYTYEIFDKWLEITKYPTEVGIRNKDIVFWQIT